MRDIGGIEDSRMPICRVRVTTYFHDIFPKSRLLVLIFQEKKPKFSQQTYHLLFFTIVARKTSTTPTDVFVCYNWVKGFLQPMWRHRKGRLLVVNEAGVARCSWFSSHVHENLSWRSHRDCREILVLTRHTSHGSACLISNRSAISFLQ